MMHGGLEQCWVKNRISLNIQIVTSSVTVLSKYKKKMYASNVSSVGCLLDSWLIGMRMYKLFKTFYWLYYHFLMVSSR